jgi:hypothetical protein
MKKLILSASALIIALSMYAQDSTNSTNSTNTNATNISNTSTSVPDNIRTSFESTYPGTTNVSWQNVTLPVFSQYSREGVGNVKWYPAMQGYRATYVANNRIMHVYYTDKGKSYAVAGPVLNSWVPEDVVTKVINQYSGAYDITLMKTLVKNPTVMNDSTAMNNSTAMNDSTAVNNSTMKDSITKEDVFQIRYAETVGGNLETVYIKPDGSPATASDVFVLK